MNLIEQYGGYEQAKEQLSGLETAPKDAYSWSRFIQADNIKQALLEYRRENNLYEVGDLVVGLTSKTDEIFQIETTSNKPDRKGEKTYAVTFVGKEGLLVGLQYRHATDEEIKQGYRNSTGK